MTNDLSGSAQRALVPAAPSDPRQSSPLVMVAIDDDPDILSFYAATFESMGVKLRISSDPRAAMDLIAAEDPNLVILDMTMPGIDGMELLSRIKQRDPERRVVMISGNYAIDLAVRAIRDGAIDYICKPVSMEKLRELVKRVRTLVAQEKRTTELEIELGEVCTLEGVIGHSPRMAEVFDLVRCVAPHFSTAVITGETGTGKELVARALHNLSARRDRPFASFNCAKLADDKVEGQLTGQRGVALTGAAGEAVGLFERANGGTVFLDEVGELSLSAQSTLLGVLDSFSMKGPDASAGRHPDVQVIASTSRDLDLETQAGRFRSDLWYRLSMVQIHLPPLRQRTDDVLLLARHFLARFAKQYRKDIRRMSRAAEASLAAYSWPGNVRELENVIGRACMLATGHVIDCGDLPEEIVLMGYGGPRSLPVGLRGQDAMKPSSPTTLRQKIREMIEHSAGAVHEEGSQETPESQ